MNFQQIIIVRNGQYLKEMVAIKRAIEPYVKKGRKLGRPKKGEDSSPFSGKSREIVADFTSNSFDTLSKAEEIVKAVEDPEKYQKLVNVLIRIFICNLRPKVDIISYL